MLLIHSFDKLILQGSYVTLKGLNIYVSCWNLRQNL